MFLILLMIPWAFNAGRIIFSLLEQLIQLVQTDHSGKPSLKEKLLTCVSCAPKVILAPWCSFLDIVFHISLSKAIETRRLPLRTPCVIPVSTFNQPWVHPATLHQTCYSPISITTQILESSILFSEPARQQKIFKIIKMF